MPAFTPRFISSEVYPPPTTNVNPRRSRYLLQQEGAAARCTQPRFLKAGLHCGRGQLFYPGLSKRIRCFWKPLQIAEVSRERYILRRSEESSTQPELSYIMSSSDDFCEEVYYIQPSAASQNAKGQENRLQHSGDCHTESTESNPGKDDAPPPLLTMRTTVNKDNGRESTQGNQVGCLTSRGEVASLDLSHEAILEHDRNNEDHQHQGGSPTTINSSVDTTNNTAALVNPFASFTYCEDKVSALMVGVPPARKIGHCSGVGQRKKLLEIQMKPGTY